MADNTTTNLQDLPVVPEDREYTVLKDEVGREYILMHDSGDSHHPDAYKVYLSDAQPQGDQPAQGDAPQAFMTEGQGQPQQDGHNQPNGDPINDDQRQDQNGYSDHEGNQDDQDAYQSRPMSEMGRQTPPDLMVPIPTPPPDGYRQTPPDMMVPFPTPPGDYQHQQHDDDPRHSGRDSRSRYPHGDQSRTSRASPMDSRNYQQPHPLKVNRKGIAIIDNDPWVPQAKVDHLNRGYKKSGGNVPIVDEKLAWKAKPRIEAKNPEYRRSGGQVEIKSEKLQWKAKPRIDAANATYKRKGGNVVIMHENLKWRHRPVVDTRNADYNPSQSEVMIFNDKLYWKAEPKVSTENLNYRPTERPPVPIIDEKPQWEKKAKVDNYKPYYIPGGGNVMIKSEKVSWDASPKVSTRNDEYVPHKGNVKIHSSSFDWHKNSKAKVNSMANANWTPAVENVYFDPARKRWIAIKDAPGTPRSVDSNIDGRYHSPDTLSEKGGHTQARINRAPKGTTLAELAERRKPPNAYTQIHKDHHKAPPHFLPPLEWGENEYASPDKKRVLFRSKDLVNRENKKGFSPQQVTPDYRSVINESPNRPIHNTGKKPHHASQKYQPPPNPKRPPWKERVEVISSKSLARNFNPIRSSPIVPAINNEWSYDEYDDYCYDSPAESVSQGVPAGYNHLRRDREQKKAQNKFSAYHQLNPVPNNTHRRKDDKLFV